MIRRPPRSTQSRSSAASDVYKRQGSNCAVGPFSYIRPGTLTAERSKVGAFCELKASSLGAGSKVPHLSYIGDAAIAENVNVGAGTITCNYDGFTHVKRHT